MEVKIFIEKLADNKLKFFKENLKVFFKILPIKKILILLIL